MALPRPLVYASGRELPVEVPQHFARAVVAGRARDAAARMGAGAAQVESLDRAAVVRMAEQRPGRPQLVERKRAVEDVAADEAEVALQVGGREGAVAEDAGAKARRVRFNDIEDAVDGL